MKTKFSGEEVGAFPLGAEILTADAQRGKVRLQAGSAAQ